MNISKNAIRKLIKECLQDVYNFYDTPNSPAEDRVKKLKNMFENILLQEADIEIKGKDRTADKDAAKKKNVDILAQRYKALANTKTSISKMRDDVKKLPAEKRKAELGRIETMEEKHSSDMAKLQSDAKALGSGTWEQIRGIKTGFNK